MITVLCAGTATDVGKTWTAAMVLSGLRRRGLRVAARKPVQSYAPEERGPTDADVLGLATGEHPDTVCPAHRWYPVALAPPMAAAHLGRDSFTVADLAAELDWGDDVADVGWAETVGGPRSPLATDGDSADLARWLRPDVVVLVADAGLGAINAVRLAAVPFAGRLLVVVLNRFDPDDDLHRANADWLAGDGFDVVTDPEELAQRLADAVAAAR
ncbi:MAG: ATP-dependent dethiobiotin synthetase BioD [Acidimicrobiia bacterium]